MLRRSALPPVQNPALEKLLPSLFVPPRYGGASIANLPATVGNLLGVQEGWASPALAPDVLAAFGDDIERVVLLLVDGLGWNRLEEQLKREDAGFSELLERHGVAHLPITSVAPSTTAVATTTILGNGAAPAETGMVGYAFLLAQLGVVANMLFWYPAWKQDRVLGELETWGLEPETFLETPSVAEVLKSANIPTRVVMPGAYKDSPLSRMRPRAAEVEGYVNATDMWHKLGKWLDHTAGKKAYAYAYYPDFDTLSHRDGSDAPVWDVLWLEFVFHLRHFFSGLSAQQRKKTLFLITADHGHVVMPVHGRRFLRDYPGLLELCSVMPGGEPRHYYLYARSGCKKALLEYARANLSDIYAVLDTEEALQAGLYGDPARMHPDTPRRLGDVVLLAKGKGYLWGAEPERFLLGMHGSLLPDEMMVPLVALRP